MRVKGTTQGQFDDRTGKEKRGEKWQKEVITMSRDKRIREASGGSNLCIENYVPRIILVVRIPFQ